MARGALATCAGAGEEPVLLAQGHHPFILPTSATMWRFTIAGISVRTARANLADGGTGYRLLRGERRPKDAHRADRGLSRTMPADEIEWWCEVVAAMKSLTTNRQGRRLSTKRILEIVTEHGGETPDHGLVKLPPGRLSELRLRQKYHFSTMDTPGSNLYLTGTNTLAYLTGVPDESSKPIWQLELAGAPKFASRELIVFNISTTGDMECGVVQC